MTEARYRAHLFRGVLNPGRLTAWCRRGDNLVRLLKWQNRARELSAGVFTEDEVRRFWWSMSAEPDMEGFIRCLGAGGVMLRRRGGAGELYSIPVFSFVVEDFFADYPVNGGEFFCPQVTTEKLVSEKGPEWWK